MVDINVEEDCLGVQPVNYDGLLEEGGHQAKIVDVMDCEDGKHCAIKFELHGTEGKDGEPRRFWHRFTWEDVKKMHDTLGCGEEEENNG